jgi:magnesium transporter
MKNNKKKLKRKEVGSSPGSLVYTGEHTNAQLEINYTQYNADTYSSKQIATKDLQQFSSDTPDVNWINVAGMNHTDALKSIGEKFGVHPLYLEDLLNVHQRPKTELSDTTLFFTLKSFESEGGELVQNQISLFLVNNFLVTFEEKDSKIFNPVQKRLAVKDNRIRSRGADYLLYALVDVIVDGYFILLDSIDIKQEEIEDRIAEGNPENIVEDVRACKKQLIQLRRAVQPLQEAVGSILHSDYQIVNDKTLPFINDTLDHVKQLNEMVETQSETNRDLGDAYSNLLSNRMNEIMKVLTVISTIFIPLSFIAGLYGMNFDHMPELHWANGYFAAIGLMLFVVLGMLFYFRKKKWF